MNHGTKFCRLCLKLLLPTILTSWLPFYPYQKDERALPGYLLTRCSFSPSDIKRLSLSPRCFLFTSTLILSFLTLSLSSCYHVSWFFRCALGFHWWRNRPRQCFLLYETLNKSRLTSVNRQALERTITVCMQPKTERSLSLTAAYISWRYSWNRQSDYIRLQEEFVDSVPSVRFTESCQHIFLKVSLQAQSSWLSNAMSRRRNES
jgi:hypothetical protein